MENIYQIAAYTRRNLIRAGIDRKEADMLVSEALNISADYTTAVKALKSL